MTEKHCIRCNGLLFGERPVEEKPARKRRLRWILLGILVPVVALLIVLALLVRFSGRIRYRLLYADVEKGRVTAPRVKVQIRNGRLAGLEMGRERWSIPLDRLTLFPENRDNW